MNTTLLLDRLSNAIVCVKQLSINTQTLEEIRALAIKNEKAPFDPVMTPVHAFQLESMISDCKLTRSKLKELLAQNITDLVREIADPIIDMTGAAVDGNGDLQLLPTLTPDGDE